MLIWRELLYDPMADTKLRLLKLKFPSKSAMTASVEWFAALQFQQLLECHTSMLSDMAKWQAVCSFRVAQSDGCYD